MSRLIAQQAVLREAQARQAAHQEAQRAQRSRNQEKLKLRWEAAKAKSAAIPRPIHDE